MEDTLRCPYDLQYCPETINAYNRFSEELATATNTDSAMLFFEQGGFSKDLPPCDNATREKCTRYQKCVKNQHGKNADNQFSFYIQKERIEELGVVVIASCKKLIKIDSNKK